MDYPGCQTGKHSSEKKEDVQKLPAQTVIRPEKEEEVIVWKGLNKPAERPSEPTEMVPITIEVTPGAAAAVEKELGKVKDTVNGGIVIGSACKHSNCEEVSFLSFLLFSGL